MRVTVLLFAAALTVPLAAQTLLIEQGRAAFERGDAETAADRFERAVAEAPGDAAAHYWLGNAYGVLAQKASVFRQASLAIRTRREFERAVQLAPGHLDARFALVEFYTLAPAFLGGGEGKASRQVCEIKARDALAGHRAQAFIYLHQRKRDFARKEYLDAVREQPDSPEAHVALGVFYLMTDKNYRAAAEEFESSIDHDPRYMPAWFEIGHMAGLTGANLSRGTDALRKCLAFTPHEDDPPPGRALYWLGVIYEKRGQRKEALQTFTESLRLDPRQGDVRAAIQDLR